MTSRKRKRKWSSGACVSSWHMWGPCEGQGSPDLWLCLSFQLVSLALGLPGEVLHDSIKYLIVLLLLFGIGYRAWACAHVSLLISRDNYGLLIWPALGYNIHFQCKIVTLHEIHHFILSRIWVTMAGSTNSSYSEWHAPPWESMWTFIGMEQKKVISQCMHRFYWLEY